MMMMMIMKMHYPNPTKTVLVTKPEHFSTAQEIFQHTGVAIKSDGARYLGGALGSVQYREACVTARANRWMEEIRALAEMAITQPHAAYVVLTKVLLGRWRYHLRCTPCPSAVLKTVDEFIDSILLTASCAFWTCFFL